MKKFLCLFLFILTCIVTSYGQNYQLHSVYIYSFIKYVQWPKNADAEFVIGIYKDSQIREHLEKMATVKKAGNKAIVVKRIDDINSVPNVHMLFIPKEASSELEVIVKKMSGSNTLLITEGEGTGAKGSNINFVVKSGKLAFELNRKAMERENLKVSSELTRLAIII